MKTNEIKFEMKTKIGEYEYEMLHVSGTPDEGETLSETIDLLKETVYAKLGRNIKKPEPTANGNGATGTNGGATTPDSGKEPLSTPVKSGGEVGDTKSKTPAKQPRKPKAKSETLASKKDTDEARDLPIVDSSQQELPLANETVTQQVVTEDFDRTNPSHRSAFNTVISRELQLVFGDSFSTNEKALALVKPIVAKMLGKEFIIKENGKPDSYAKEFEEEVKKLVSEGK
jgi:hypothetical protein